MKPTRSGIRGVTQASKNRWKATIQVNGGGNRHRKVVKGGCTFYYMLKKNGWPKDKYRLLCLNCNCSYGYYGYCPHQRIENK